jgi:hypothetical protein
MRLATLANLRFDPNDGLCGSWTREQLEAMNARFTERLEAAFAAGLESRTSAAAQLRFSASSSARYGITSDSSDSLTSRIGSKVCSIGDGQNRAWQFEAVSLPELAIAATREEGTLQRRPRLPKTD